MSSFPTLHSGVKLSLLLPAKAVSVAPAFSCRLSCPPGGTQEATCVFPPPLTLLPTVTLDLKAKGLHRILWDTQANT